MFFYDPFYPLNSMKYNKQNKEIKEKENLFKSFNSLRTEFYNLYNECTKEDVSNNYNQFILINRMFEEIEDNARFATINQLKECKDFIVSHFEKLKEDIKETHKEDLRDMEMEETKNVNKKEDVNEIDESEIWVYNKSFYYNGRMTKERGILNVYVNKTNTLIKFVYDFFYNNQFKQQIKRDYKIINQFFDIFKMEQLWNSENLEYIKVLNNPNDYNILLKNAIEYLKFMVEYNKEFTSYIDNKPQVIKKGITEVQRFINLTLDNYSDVHDFKYCFKKIVKDYFNHEFVDKNSLDYLLVYVPLDKLKAIYPEPKIWVFDNYDFGF